LKTQRVRQAQEALDAAIKEFCEASDEQDLANARRLGNIEAAEGLEKLLGSVVTHWAIAVSRTYWARDLDDPEDATEYPRTEVSANVRDDTMPGWMVQALLRAAANAI
jgi:hypothetical protein